MLNNVISFAWLKSIGLLITCENEEKSSEESSKEDVNEDGSKEDSKIEETSQNPPHIIFILADDLGWNDVSFHGSPQIPTPNIDALAASGIVLNNYYTESMCTPSRASLMTGKYPIHTGLQHLSIRCGEPTALSLDLKIMPEYLKDKGYMNHMVGKWHLGYFRQDYTPIMRGFNSFFGFYTGKIDYFDYTNYEKSEDLDGKAFFGVDLQDGTETLKTFRGRYATDVFTEKAVEIINNHNESMPLFLYLSHLAPHTGNQYMPLQAPVNYVQKLSHIKDSKRRTFAGMVSALDASVGKVVEALNQRNLLRNSIIVFTSNSGGETESSGQGKGSNWPLRGQKLTSFEGGIRVPSVLWSPLLKLETPRTANQLMHVSDWLPTLYSAAGGELSDLGEIDGSNMWDSLQTNSPSPRMEILHNIDPIAGTYALRRGDYKLIFGPLNEITNNWAGPTGLEDMPAPPSMDEWVFNNDSTVKSILQEANLWIIDTPDVWRTKAVVKCEGSAPLDGGGCDKSNYPCLFNVPADPCEYQNIAPKYPKIVKSMLEGVEKCNASALTPTYTDRDPQGDPRCHAFTYAPWLDEELGF
ncbi:hypothetical protein JTE90_010986 [Oedothorax gibbosus]|uniref:Sulfatase N-terminal domain-containing protein n=1 Tax=Oedothorax gibbosus TaxID=931172 RepID=A0AAV6VC76_9ARAC|nr:hypothetical protein JTE90_010986 [Oedothorax gibbosus]